MSRKRKIISAESLYQEIEALVKEDMESPGAWNMFTQSTIKDLKFDYDITMTYLASMTKEHFDFVCEAIDEVIYYFQKPEMVDLIENLFRKFYGSNTDCDFYRDNIAILHNF